MSNLTKLRYAVTVTGATHDVVEVRWADQLLAEREAPRHGITREQPLHLTTYWCWAALTRGQEYSGDFQMFMADPDLDIVPLEDEPVDPTQLPAGADSASP